MSRSCIVIWGFVSQLPKQLLDPEKSIPYALSSVALPGVYVHDVNHFLLILYRRRLRPWIRDLVLYNGFDVKGLIQVLPTVGLGHHITMGDILCRAIHHEANFPMNQLRIRFYTGPSQLLKPHEREKQGLLTFEVSEFLSLLEMVSVFRRLLRPEEQEMLREILSIDEALEEQFHWGRFQGKLSRQARDMLNSWKIRQWPKNRIRLLYELIDYVYIKFS